MIQRKFSVQFANRITLHEFNKLWQVYISGVRYPYNLRSLALAAMLNNSATVFGGHSMQPSIAELYAVRHNHERSLAINTASLVPNALDTSS
jgi:hypothetical protein